MPAIAKLGLIALWAAAAAGAPAPLIHDDPAPDDNLRIYMFVGAADASVVLDGAGPSAFSGQSAGFARMAPGSHTWTVTLADGAAREATFSLSADDMIESKGRRWWCIAAGRPNGQLTLLQLDPARCKGIADAGPD